ncbi:hypothetical protein LF1_52070 [Rubripirellula obstinata]|uniref:Uncharacterized protein n=1 Tax=Rubripirellula obstinata TaxID=406547 RepID=A0A5B1C8A6_9BACT|nr:hypothetical protein LF1_52070 [Rubripirellula obstinata]
MSWLSAVRRKCVNVGIALECFGWRVRLAVRSIAVWTWCVPNQESKIEEYRSSEIVASQSTIVTQWVGFRIVSVPHDVELAFTSDPEGIGDNRRSNGDENEADQDDGSNVVFGKHVEARVQMVRKIEVTIACGIANCWMRLQGTQKRRPWLPNNVECSVG